MANPKQRHTKGRRDRARTQYLQQPVDMQPCPNCTTPKMPHVICATCGEYKGRSVVDTVKRVERKKRKEA